MWGKTIIDGLKCVPPDELLKYGDDMIAVILVEKCYQQEEISKQLEAENVKSIGIKMEWLYTDDLIEKYLDIHLPAVWNGSMEMGKYKRDINRDKKIAVYTCIIGGYDDLIQPLVEDPRCDYYLLGLNQPENMGVYKWVDITGKIPDCIREDYHRINRYCKIHPHIFFPQYDYSIYVDGRVQIQTIISHLPEKLSKIGIASYGIGGVAAGAEADRHSPRRPDQFTGNHNAIGSNRFHPSQFRNILQIHEDSPQHIEEGPQGLRRVPQALRTAQVGGGDPRGFLNEQLSLAGTILADMVLTCHGSVSPFRRKSWARTWK